MLKWEMIHQNGGFYYLWTDSGKWEIAQAWWLKTGLIGFERNKRQEFWHYTYVGLHSEFYTKDTSAQSPTQSFNFVLSHKAPPVAWGDKNGCKGE